jgi:MFS family permease
MCIPVGYAAGYIFGGLLAGPLGWRGVFWLEAAVMVPIVIFCMLAPPIDLHGKNIGADTPVMDVLHELRVGCNKFLPLRLL